MKNLFILFLVSICFLATSYSNSNKLNFRNLQGLYEYCIVEHNNNKVKGTLFSVNKLEKYYENNLLQMNNDILGVVFYSDDKVQKLWDVNNDCKGEFYTIHSSEYKNGYEWSLERELGFSVGSFERKFKCLSTDTTLELPSQMMLKDITIVEQQELIDVGGFWEITQYGFDNDFKLVFFSKSIINPRDQKIVNQMDFLVLNEFHPKSNLTENEIKEWQSKNSKFSKKWLDSLYDDNDVIEFSEPPPEE